MEQHVGTGRWGQIYPESSDYNTNRSGQSHGPQAALGKIRNVCLYVVERSHIMRATVYATSSRPLHIEPASKKRNMDASGEGVCVIRRLAKPTGRGGYDAAVYRRGAARSSEIPGSRSRLGIAAEVGERLSSRLQHRGEGGM